MDGLLWSGLGLVTVVALLAGIIWLAHRSHP
jgi:hypothetical protein